jgi:hypothetical protein
MITRIHVLLVSLVAVGLLAVTGNAEGPAYTKPRQAKRADKAFSIQGEYVGTIDHDDEDLTIGLQIVALGANKFMAVGIHGGLPGAGGQKDTREATEAELNDDGTIRFENDNGAAIYKDGGVTIVAEGNEIGTLKRTDRKSPTLGLKPPQGAIVLFDGKSADMWENGKLDGRLLMQGVTSKQKFASHTLHIEFRLPYEPENRGQGRGNSGLYLQGRYEVQMLDSFGLEGKDNECGGIYSIGAPRENMCLPPLTWQTYDVDFTAAKYVDGKVTENPRITVRHNGVVIHENLELPKSTTASPLKPGPEPGPVYLQNHGNEVRYRNIWVLSK